MIPRFAICKLRFAICNRRSLAHFQLPIALCLPLLFAPPALAQRNPPRISAEGTEGFRAVLATYKLTPATNLAEFSKLDPKQTLLISFRSSDNEGVTDFLESLKLHVGYSVREFIDDGGAILFASDRKLEGGWAADFDVHIAANMVFAQGLGGYRQEYKCPFVVRAPNADPNLFRTRGGLSAELRVATNKPSYLESSSSLPTLARFQHDVRVEELTDVIKRTPPFAQGKQFASGGRLLVLSDQSVFINSMLLPPPGAENDNLDFTFNCLDWLTEAKEGKRKHVMFVNDNAVQSDFSLILKSLPPQTPEQIMDYLREHPDEIIDYLRKHPELIWNNLDKASPLVAILEDEGVFDEIEKQNLIDRLLLEHFDHWVFVRNALILGALLLLGYGVRRFVASKQSAPWGPRFSVALERFRPRVGLLEQRLREGFRAGEHYEEARERARAMFAEMGLSPAAEGPPPAFEIQASWWARRRIEADLREIWRVAHGPEPEPISERKWQKWPARMRFLRDQIRAGTVRFLT
jgi:hypothetical protein